jgi:dCMP deaminase
MNQEEKRQSIHVTMMGIAQVMSTRSTCARRKVGAVITDVSNQILSTGYNGVPRGWLHCTNIPCAGANSPSGTNIDACEAVHAEANAMTQCQGIDKAHNIYVTTLCCVSCIKLLLNTTIQDIYFIERYAQSDRVMEMWCKGNRRIIEMKGPVININAK